MAYQLPRSIEEIELLEQYWQAKSRESFWAFRQYIRHARPDGHDQDQVDDRVVHHERLVRLDVQPRRRDAVRQHPGIARDDVRDLGTVGADRGLSAGPHYSVGSVVAYAP